MNLLVSRLSGTSNSVGTNGRLDCAATEPGLRTDQATIGAVLTYRNALNEAMTLSPTGRFFTHLDVEGGLSRTHGESRRVLEAAIRSAQKRTGERAVRRLTTRSTKSSPSR